jgi:hypothetical protein
MAKTENDVQVTMLWQDLTVIYPELASGLSFVELKSGGAAVVNFSSSATAPNPGHGESLLSQHPFMGTAAHIWVMALAGTATVSCGLCDPVASGGGGGAISNTSFGISGTLPGFAATPTFNLGTAPSLTIGTLPALPAGTNSIGTVLGPLPAAPIVGQQTLTTSAAPLPSNALLNGIAITALPASTGTVYVGGSGVTAATGYPLGPGQSISFAVANASGIFIVGTNTTDKVAFAGN